MNNLTKQDYEQLIIVGALCLSMFVLTIKVEPAKAHDTLGLLTNVVKECLIKLYR